MTQRDLLVPLLAVALSIGFALPGRAQMPTCDGCFTVPLAASGNPTCFVNMCFTYDPVAQRVTVTSVQKVTATDCSGVGVAPGSNAMTSQLMEAVEKEAIRIVIDCQGCTTGSPRIFSSARAMCLKQVVATKTWVGCQPEICRTSYEVTCKPGDPYSWTWGAKWGSASSSVCNDQSCQSFCPWCS